MKTSTIVLMVVLAILMTGVIGFMTYKMFKGIAKIFGNAENTQMDSPEKFAEPQQKSSTPIVSIISCKD